MSLSLDGTCSSGHPFPVPFIPTIFSNGPVSYLKIPTEDEQRAGMIIFLEVAAKTEPPCRICGARVVFTMTERD